MMLLLVATCIPFTSCSKDDDNEKEQGPKYNDITIIAGSTYTIENGSNWTSEEPLIAEVSGNVITAKIVGQTTIRNDKYSFTVTITPRYNLYKDPYLVWGASMSSVKSYMNGFTLAVNDSESLMYDGKGGAEVYMYLFENNKLTSSAVLVDAEKYNERLAEFLFERYIFVNADDEEFIVTFINVEKNMAVSVQYTIINGSIFAMVMYFPVSLDEAKTRSSFNSKFDKLKDKFKLETTKGNPEIKDFIELFKQN